MATVSAAPVKEQNEATSPEDLIRALPKGAPIESRIQWGEERHSKGASAEHLEARSRRNGRDDCPECGSPLIHQGGCMDCPCCGWSACG
jgi:ribonucleoside-diphosphate reductase alpha chain